MVGVDLLVDGASAAGRAPLAHEVGGLLGGPDLDALLQALDQFQVLEGLLVEGLPDVEADRRGEQRRQRKQLAVRGVGEAGAVALGALGTGGGMRGRLEPLEVQDQDVDLALLDPDRRAEHPDALRALLHRLF